MYSSQNNMFQQQYGSAPIPYHAPDDFKVPANMTPRRQVNLLAVILVALVPPLLFTAAYAIMSFAFHYKHPGVVYPVVSAGLLIVSLFLIIGFQTYRKQKRGLSDRDPSWWFFGAIALLIALILGVVLGNLNFWSNMQPVYDIENLNAYPDVNPAVERGGQLMDAGRVAFTSGSRLDFSKSMRFRNYDDYCVVPVVQGTNKVKQETYDFWVVGLNCCEGPIGEFRCGEFNNPEAHSGLRLMRDTQRPYFRLAVQQAEAAFDITAKQPLFFYWMEDPGAEVGSYRDAGYKMFLVGLLSHFSLNLLFVVLAVVLISKSNR